MAALTADTTNAGYPRAGTQSFVLENGTLYAGSFVGIDTDGYLAPWANVAGYNFQGTLLDGDRSGLEGPITGDTSATPPPEGRVDTSGSYLEDVPVAGAVQSSMGAPVYCATDNPADLTLTPTTNVDAIGYVARFQSAGRADVALFTPAEYVVQATP